MVQITKKPSQSLVRIMFVPCSYHVRITFGQGLFHAFPCFEAGLKSGAVAWLVQGRW